MSLTRVRFLTLAIFAMVASVAVNMIAFQGRTFDVASSKLKVANGESDALATRSARHGDRLVTPPPALASEVAERGHIALITAIQRELVTRGYEPGEADGAAGMTTRAAVFAYQYDHGLPLTAEPHEEVLEALILGLPKVPGGAIGALGPHAERLVRTVQSSLKALGFDAGAVDGQLGPQTRSAIQQFEMNQGLQPSGRISAPLIRALGRTRIAPQAAVR